MQIGMIYEQQGDLESAIEYQNQFLDLCKRYDFRKKEGLAHKLLAEVHSKNGSIGKAIDHLKDVMTIASKDQNNSALAEATLKLGLLYNKEGKERNIKKSAEVLREHFDLLRQEDIKDQSAIDHARVNLGIVEANMKIDTYKYMVLNDLQGLVNWKIHRDPKYIK